MTRKPAVRTTRPTIFTVKDRATIARECFNLGSWSGVRKQFRIKVLLDRAQPPATRVAWEIRTKKIVHAGVTNMISDAMACMENAMYGRRVEPKESSDVQV